MLHDLAVTLASQGTPFLSYGGLCSPPKLRRHDSSVGRSPTPRPSSALVFILPVLVAALKQAVPPPPPPQPMPTQELLSELTQSLLALTQSLMTLSENQQRLLEELRLVPCGTGTSR